MMMIRMPSPAENIDAVTLAAWRIAPGAMIEPGREVADLITEKAAFPLESPVAGRVSHVLAAPGSVLPPGYILVLLDAEAADVERAIRENDGRIAELAAGTPGGVFHPPPAETAPPREGSDVCSASPPGRFGSGAAVRATPAARRLAKERGIALAAIAASLPPGALIKEDHVREVISMHPLENK